MKEEYVKNSKVKLQLKKLGPPPVYIIVSAQHITHNEEIAYDTIEVINENGLKIGTMTRDEGIARAKAIGLDLALVSDEPPRAKFVDLQQMRAAMIAKKKAAPSCDCFVLICCYCFCCCCFFVLNKLMF